MKTRKLAAFDVSEVAFGCMSLSHAYGGRPDKDTAQAILNKALDVGYTLLDTAALYGAGANETLVGETLKHRRGEYTLASKGGLRIIDGKRHFNGTPDGIQAACEDSLRRLQTDVIDLYYLHRLDPGTPVEESVGGLARLVEQGKVRAIGLSEVSADTLRRACAVYPVAALQSEYSLWSRNAELGALQACSELGVAYVAFSPLARGFLTGKTGDADSLEAGDIRKAMPRFQGDDYRRNAKLLSPFADLARQAGCSMAQLAMAWVLAQGEHIVALPGTGKMAHMIEDAEASDVVVDEDILSKAGVLINQTTVAGPRYNAATQTEIDTEEFAA
jgi:aryl-alcohol dehydrogenase-like predicted oxidoreductase